MSGDTPPFTRFDIDGVVVDVTPDARLIGVWIVHVEGQLLGTVAVTHSYGYTPPVGYIVHPANQSPVQTQTWIQSLRRLLPPRSVGASHGER